MRGGGGYHYVPDMPNDTQPTKSAGGSGDKIIYVRLPEDIRNQAAAAAITTGFKKSDVYRLAIARGIAILVDQITATTNTSEQ